MLRKARKNEGGDEVGQRVLVHDLSLLVRALPWLGPVQEESVQEWAVRR